MQLQYLSAAADSQEIQNQLENQFSTRLNLGAVVVDYKPLNTLISLW